MVFSNWVEGVGLFEDITFISGLIGGVWLVGRVVWSRQRLVDRLTAQAEELERGRAAEARAAAAEERARIARDVHDVVAHSVSVMVVQAEAGEALLDDPERAGAALRAIQQTGRATLGDLRELLGVLSDDESAGSLVPSPRLQEVDRLADRLRQAGLDVSLHVEGPAAELPPGVGLAAYRVLQEALTNALRHAGQTSVRARVDVGDQAVVVEVVDNGPAAVNGRPLAASGAGHGLIGMRERVTRYGGRVESGPSGPGFRVWASIPVRPE
jgi:signal transduction histidine kinase